MSAALQSLLVMGIIGIAALYLAARSWRTYRAAHATQDRCGSDCGCSR